MNIAVNEILLACRNADLDYRSNPASPDGPWRAVCPVCRTHSDPDDRPLVITSNGFISCKHGCDTDKIAGLLIAPDVVAAAGTTWAAVELTAALEGRTEEPPAILARSDGRCLIYPGGRIHAFHAEPEALKTWLLLKAISEPLMDGDPALFIDFEDSAASIVQRLLDLGVTTTEIAHGLIYIRPDEPLTEATLPDLDRAIDRRPALAVIDGVTEAFSRNGLNPLDNSDVANWLDLLPRRITRAGIPTVTLDHVVKDREQRGRYAIGAQHKLAGVDVAYSLKVIEPFGRGRDGLVVIKVEKDRPGRVREFAKDGQVALLKATSRPDGSVSLSLEPPDLEATPFRPTGQMERISLAVETDPGLSKRAIREAVRGKRAVADLALEMLISERYIDVRRDGQTCCHHSLKPYREADEDPQRGPVAQPWPDRGPDTVKPSVAPWPPLKGTDTGHTTPATEKAVDRGPHLEVVR